MYSLTSHGNKFVVDIVLLLLFSIPNQVHNFSFSFDLFVSSVAYSLVHYLYCFLYKTIIFIEAFPIRVLLRSVIKGARK